MSASQARYLQLTARKNNLEYEAQQISQKRLTLAQRTEKLATAYSEKMNDRRLYYEAPYTLENAIDEETGVARTLVKFGEGYTKRLDYYDITNAVNDEHQPGLGMRIVNKDGKIVVASIPAGEDPDKYVVDATIAPNQFGSSSLYENACNYLEDKLRTGEWLLQKPNVVVSETEEGEESTIIDWIDTNYFSDNSICDKLYSDNDSAATAEYTAQSEILQRQDKMLELALTKVQTEQKAIETEMDSVKKVIDKNVETTFKTFG